MTILSERVTWKRPRSRSETQHSSDLTPDEQANVRTAIRWLRKRFGSSTKLATAMRSKAPTVDAAMRGTVSAGIALRVARVASVSIEEILAGRWPSPKMCPYCGRA